MTSTRCVFCEVICGSLPADIVARDDRFIAFLDVRPLFVGHTLVVPIDHHETLGDLPAGDVAHLFAQVQRLSVAIPGAMEATGSFVAMNNVVSQSVPHLHVHVVPRRPKDGLRGFFWPRTKYDSVAHAAATAARIGEAYRRTT